MKSKIIDEDVDELVSTLNHELESLEGKNIFITGGKGFMGSYIIDVLSQFNKTSRNPCNITTFDKNPVVKHSRLDHLLDRPNITFLTGDVCKPFEVPKNTNIIIHAASKSSTSSFMKSPLETADANVHGIRNLLDYARENLVDNFIFFSSSEVYGNPVKEFIPTPETYTGNVDPLSPYACYSESKRFSETLSSIFFREYGVPVKLLRILHCYGPGMKNDGKVVSDFYVSAKENKEISLRDNGEAKRSLCYIKDSIDGVFRVMFYGKSGEAYNIANDKEIISIRDLANKISKIVGNNSFVKPNFDIPADRGDGNPIRNLDISKLKLLGFNPKISLEDGLYRLKRHEEEVGYL